MQWGGHGGSGGMVTHRWDGLRRQGDKVRSEHGLEVGGTIRIHVIQEPGSFRKWDTLRFLSPPTRGEGIFCCCKKNPVVKGPVHTVEKLVTTEHLASGLWPKIANHCVSQNRQGYTDLPKLPGTGAAYFQEQVHCYKLQT